MRLFAFTVIVVSALLNTMVRNVEAVEIAATEARAPVQIADAR
mgnify:CR=1 FL=1